MWSYVLLGLAQAAVPEGVRPAVAPVNVQERYDRYLEQKGLGPAPLACEAPIADALRLCFKVWEGEHRRWVVQSDLTTWGVSQTDLREAVVKRAEDALNQQMTAVMVSGATKTYLQLADGDGWAAAGLLAPQTLLERVAQPLMAIPRTSVMVAWPAGDAELDLMMAVGIKEMRDGSRDPVSGLVLRWNGKQWVAFAEAQKKTGPTP